MALPSISIVIPVFNGAETVGACLESVLAQEYPRDLFDVIVVENGSTDGTRAVVERYPVRLLSRPSPSIAAARNMGTAASGADIIACTDADCVADPRWLAEVTQPFDNPSVGGAGGPILAYAHAQRTDVERFCEEFPPLSNSTSGDDTPFLPRLLTANAAYRRSLLNQIGGFRDLFTGSDVDISWRLQLETATCLRYTPNAVVYHHHRATYAGLARQYRRYGFGEIYLDTLYRRHRGYPRTRRYQCVRMAEQCGALLRYAASAAVRGVRRATGRATPYEAIVPLLWLLIEGANLVGKCEALVATRAMTVARPAMVLPHHRLFRRLISQRKE